MVTPPKYRIVLYHPAWYKPWGDHQVSLEMWDGRTGKYKGVSVKDVGVRDIHGRNGTK